MTTAYVLIMVTRDQTRNVLKGLRRIPGVKSAHAVTGPYDVIATVRAKDVAAIGTPVLAKIRALKGVSKTMTCVALEV